MIHFTQYTSRIVEEMEQIHRTEIEKRKEFAQRFDNHFLSSLFQGLDECPPSFATQRPRPFDTKLPEVMRKTSINLKSVAENYRGTKPVPVLCIDWSRRAYKIEGNLPQSFRQAVCTAKPIWQSRNFNSNWRVKDEWSERRRIADGARSNDEIEHRHWSESECTDRIFEWKNH